VSVARVWRAFVSIGTCARGMGLRATKRRGTAGVARGGFEARHLVGRNGFGGCRGKGVLLLLWTNNMFKLATR